MLDLDSNQQVINKVRRVNNNMKRKIELEKIIELYSKGYSTVEIAKMYNMTAPAIWQRLKKIGLNRNRHEAQRLRWAKARGDVYG
jgi:predicted DNA-binding protein YlxM (UPF0122 family)